MTESEKNVHIPVLADEIVALLGGSGDPQESDGWIVDATLGAGGHSATLLERFPRVRVLGIDQDPEILTVARERLEPFGKRVQIERCRISELSRLMRKLRMERPVGFLMDVGVSSLQLDRPDRGFSFSADGPLDMRMDPDRQRTAADVVNNWDEADLADLFYYEGGERRSRQIARAIVEARRRVPFQRTAALADGVAVACGHRAGRIHPATRVFQALRRAVNAEGDELIHGLKIAERVLGDGGRLVVISFHSGEDGVVKRFLQERARERIWQLVTKKPLGPGATERRSNPRARSARLRCAGRTRGNGAGLQEKDPAARPRRSQGGGGPM